MQRSRRVARAAFMACLMSALALSSAARAADSTDGRTADLPGVKLNYYDSGGSGVPVIFLHANTGTGASWANQIAAFAKAGYRAIAFDRRGWGRSMADAATGPQPGTVADDLDALAAHLKLDRFHLVGVAGGGFVAIDYAAWRPEKLRSVVIAASTGRIQDKEITEFSARLAWPGFATLAEVYREVGPSYRGADPEGTARWVEAEHHARQKGAPAQPLRSVNTFAKLQTLATPALIVAADADLIAPPGLMRVWAPHVKGHEWAVIPEAGHSIAWEQPDRFNEAVLAFVKKH